MTLNLHRAGSQRKRAFAMLEYVMLVIILAAGLFTFRAYIQRSVQGQYRKAGESFGFARQYNPGASRECAFEGTTNTWYSQECFNNKVNCKTQTAETYDACVDAAKAACTLGCTSK